MRIRGLTEIRLPAYFGRSMKITTEHESSSFGVPVILDDAGRLMDYKDGIRALQNKLQLGKKGLALRCGVSPRTVEGWDQGRMPSAAALNLMALLLLDWNAGYRAHPRTPEEKRKRKRPRRPELAGLENPPLEIGDG
jgi:hypothetical protein